MHAAPRRCAVLVCRLNLTLSKINMQPHHNLCIDIKYFMYLCARTRKLTYSKRLKQRSRAHINCKCKYCFVREEMRFISFIINHFMPAFCAIAYFLCHRAQAYTHGLNDYHNVSGSEEKMSNKNICIATCTIILLCSGKKLIFFLVTFLGVSTTAKRYDVMCA